MLDTLEVKFLLIILVTTGILFIIVAFFLGTKIGKLIASVLPRLSCRSD